MTKRFLWVLFFLVNTVFSAERCPQSFATSSTALYIKKKYCSEKVAHTVTKISSLPTVITQPGTYVLHKDFCFLQDAQRAAAITICANGVTIDFKGHTLQIAGSQARGIVVTNKNDIRIQGGTITGTQTTSDSIGPTSQAQFGFMADESAHIIIDDMVFRSLGAGVNLSKTTDVTLQNSLFEEGVTGIQAAAFGFGEDPFTISSVDGLTIRDTQIRMMSQFGIFLRANIFNVLIERTIIDSIEQDGMHVPLDILQADNVRISATQIGNTGGSGIFIEPLCRNWIIENCQLRKNGRNGIQCNGPRNLMIRDCQLFQSGLSGIFIGVRYANDITIQSTEINNAGEIPLRIDNAANLFIEKTNITNYLPSTMPTVRLVDIMHGVLKDMVISNESAQTESNALFIRGSQGLICSHLSILMNTIAFTDDEQRESTQGNAVLFAGGNQNCSLQSSTVTSGRAGRVPNPLLGGTGACGVAVIQDTVTGQELSGLNSSILINDCTVSNTQGSGIFIDNEAGVTITNNTVSYSRQFGISFSDRSINSLVENNSVFRNALGGIFDAILGNNRIFHNFAQVNGQNQPADNFIGIDPTLIVPPGPGVGVLENISS